MRESKSITTELVTALEILDKKIKEIKHEMNTLPQIIVLRKKLKRVRKKRRQFSALRDAGVYYSDGKEVYPDWVLERFHKLTTAPNFKKKKCVQCKKVTKNMVRNMCHKCYGAWRYKNNGTFVPLRSPKQPRRYRDYVRKSLAVDNET